MMGIYLIRNIGAVLFKDPVLVAEVCKSMKAAVSIPITVKCRLGVDDKYSYDEFVRFVETVAIKGEVKHFIVHARNAILNVFECLGIITRTK